MNHTIVRLTAQALLGGRRMLLMGSMSVLLVGLAVIVEAFLDPPTAADRAQFLQVVSLGTLLPLFGLIVGTGVIGPEIDDGSIMHVLAKPVSRPKIVISKLSVAFATVTTFAVVPTVLAALVMNLGVRTALAFGAGALAAGAVYSVLFLLLAIVTRQAVILGLVYALLWEGVVGGFVPGARNLSVQQWVLSVTESIAPQGLLEAHVRLGVAYPLMIAVLIFATWYAGARLRVLAPFPTA